MHRTLEGGRIQRVGAGRIGACDVVLLQVRLPGETWHAVIHAGRGVGVVGPDEARRLRDAAGEAPLPSLATLRATLDGGCIEHMGTDRIEVDRDGVRSTLRSASPRELRVESRATTPPVAAGEGERATWADWLARGAAIAEGAPGDAVSERRRALRNAVAKASARLARRIAAVTEDLERASAAIAAAERATFFVGRAKDAPRGATRLEAVDWSTGEAQPITMALDPSKSAAEQIDAIFRRSRRLHQGAKIARQRLDEAQRARDALAAIAAEIARDPTEERIEHLEAEARRAAPSDLRGAPPGKAKREPAERATPYRSFAAASGAAVLVGRGARQNDVLTLRVARPHDLWLHAKNRTGAHVVVPLDKGKTCPPELLVEAAHLAAHFSEARDENVVEITYTPRRYVRKPRGSAEGAVVVDREKVIVLRKDEALLRGLLDRESRAWP